MTTQDRRKVVDKDGPKGEQYEVIAEDGDKIWIKSPSGYYLTASAEYYVDAPPPVPKVGDVFTIPGLNYARSRVLAVAGEWVVYIRDDLEIVKPGLKTLEQFKADYPVKRVG